MKNIRNRFVIAIAALSLGALALAAAGKTFSGNLDAGEGDTRRYAAGVGTWDCDIVGRGNGADFDVYVYNDDTGRLLAKDDDYDNIPMVRFRLDERTNIKVVVKNNGDRSGSYTGEIY